MTTVQHALKSSKRPSNEGAALQRAREDARISREELARRRCLIEPTGSAFSDFSFGLNALERMERSRKCPPTPRCLSVYRALIAAGPPDTPDDVVVEHWDQLCLERRRQRLDELRGEGTRLAKLVWNAAEDPRFLDLALTEMLSQIRGPLDNPTGYVNDPEHLKGGSALMLRSALLRLATELRVMFPDRSELESS